VFHDHEQAGLGAFASDLVGDTDLGKESGDVEITEGIGEAIAEARSKREEELEGGFRETGSFGFDLRGGKRNDLLA
jgi:hypothetical protein